MKLKNIVIINDYANINGGTANVAISSANELAKKGYKVKFICATGKVDCLLKHPNIEVISTEQKDILNKNKIKSSIEGIWNIKSYTTVISTLDRLDRKETIVHVHGWMKALSPSVIKAIINSGFKYCITTHDYFSICPNGGLYNYNENKVCDIVPMSIKCLRCNCDKRSYTQKIWRYIRGFVQKCILLNQNINYISISKNNAKMIKTRFKNSRFYFLENPTDVKKDDRIKVEGNLYYGVVGRISNEKGIDIVARASKKMNYNIVIIGSGPLEKEILDINKDIEITGWLSKEEVIEKMKGLRACILPSRWYEGMPLVVGEAMSMGIPMIISDICNAKEKIIDNNNGLIFKNESIESLITNIEKLEDNSRLKKISENAYKSFWEQDSTLSCHVQKLINIYGDIIRSKEVIDEN